MFQIGKVSKVIKVLNNSAMIVEQKHQEFVLVGSGIAFQKKAGMILINEDNIEKAFIFTNHKDSLERIISELQTVDFSLISNAMEIVVDLIGKEIREEQMLTFFDHLAITYTRIIKDDIIDNPFLYETKALYKESYQKAVILADRLQQTNGIIMPEAEIGFIALHIQSMEYNQQKDYPVKKLNGLFFAIKEVLENECDIEWERKEDTYGRFLSHIKFLLSRILQDYSLENELKDVIEERYQAYYPVANKIKQIIEDELGCQLSDDEVSFIVIHVQRIMEK